MTGCLLRAQGSPNGLDIQLWCQRRATRWGRGWEERAMRAMEMGRLGETVGVPCVTMFSLRCSSYNNAQNLGVHSTMT